MSEPTLNKKIEVVATYDGYVLQGGTSWHDFNLDKITTYHTSLDAIAPVALRVREAISELFYEMKESNPFFNTDSHKNCLKTLNEVNGAISTLDPLAIFNAVYNAIILLKKYET